MINNLTQSIQSIKAQFQNAEEKYNLLQANFENQKLSFQKSEEKYKEGLMDAYTFFVVRNGWLQANYNLINSKNDVVQQIELLKVFEAGFYDTPFPFPPDSAHYHRLYLPYWQ